MNGPLFPKWKRGLQNTEYNIIFSIGCEQFGRTKQKVRTCEHSDKLTLSTLNFKNQTVQLTGAIEFLSLLSYMNY